MLPYWSLHRWKLPVINIILFIIDPRRSMVLSKRQLFAFISSPKKRKASCQNTLSQ